MMWNQDRLALEDRELARDAVALVKLLDIELALALALAGQLREQEQRRGRTALKCLRKTS